MEASQQLTTLSWDSLIAYDNTPEISAKKIKWMGKYLQRCVDNQENLKVLIISAGSLFVRAQAEQRANIVQAFKNVCAGHHLRTYTKQHFLKSAGEGNYFQCLCFYQLLGNDLFNQQDPELRTPLHLAALTGELQTIRFMIQCAENLERSPDKDGRTPIFLAVQENHLDAVQQFLSSGSDRNQTDKYGMTPLHVAVDGGLFDMVKFLSKRADGEPSSCLKVKDNRGRRPVDMAQKRQSEFPRIFEYLASFNYDH